MWKLKSNAHHAREALRAGQRLKKKVDSGMLPIDKLDRCQKQLLNDMAARVLHVAVDSANKAYGHGIARTNDFGFKSGENMCRDVSMEVKAYLRIARTLRS